MSVQSEPQPVSNVRSTGNIRCRLETTEETTETPVEATETSEESNAALAAKRRRDLERAKAREAKAATDAASVTTPTTSLPTPAVATQVKSGAKKIVVTVTYDESGRVTQASGGDAGAVRIARQKRFPPGKAGSATVTIPVN